MKTTVEPAVSLCKPTRWPRCIIRLRTSAKSRRNFLLVHDRVVIPRSGLSRRTTRSRNNYVFVLYIIRRMGTYKIRAFNVTTYTRAGETAGTVVSVNSSQIKSRDLRELYYYCVYDQRVFGLVPQSHRALLPRTCALPSAVMCCNACTNIRRKTSFLNDIIAYLF